MFKFYTLFFMMSFSSSLLRAEVTAVTDAAICVKQNFRADEDSFIAWVIRFPDKNLFNNELNNRLKYRVQIIKYDELLRAPDHQHKTVVGKPVKIQSKDNGFSVQLNSYRIELLALDLTRRDTASAAEKSEIIRAELKASMPTFYNWHRFPAHLRFVDKDISINEAMWCYSDKIETLLDDTAPAPF